MLSKKSSKQTISFNVIIVLFLGLFAMSSYLYYYKDPIIVKKQNAYNKLINSIYEDKDQLFAFREKTKTLLKLKNEESIKITKQKERILKINTILSSGYEFNDIESDM